MISIMMNLIVLVVLVATVASITRLMTTDEITAPWRVKIRRRSGEFGFLTRLLECNRCAAVWAAPLPTGLTLGCAMLLESAPWWMWAISPVLWILTSLGVAYLAFLLLLRGE
jgi:hypothetical protein